MTPPKHGQTRTRAGVHAQDPAVPGSLRRRL